MLDKIGLVGPVAGTSIATRGIEVAKQSVASASVRTALAGATGERIGDIWKSAAAGAVLATAQTTIGDIGIAHDLEEGGLAKIALHAGTGAAISGAFGENAMAGAIGGAAGELVPSLMSSEQGNNSPPQTQQIAQQKVAAITKLTASTAAFLTGQNASGIGQAANVAGSVVAHNRRLHPEELKVLEQLKSGKTPEEQQRLTLAAASRVHASAGVNEADVSYGQIAEAEVAGKFYSTELTMLDNAAAAAGKPELFQYGWGDSASDFASRNNELIVRSVGGIKVGVGAAGVAGAAGIGALAAPATGGASGVLAAGVGTGSLYYAADGYNQAFGDYQHTEGASVIQSFNQPTSSFESELGTKAAYEAAGAAAIYGGGKLVGKLASTKVGQQVLGKAGDAVGSVVNRVAGKGGVAVKSVNAQKALRNKLRVLESAQKNAVKTKVLDDGRIRYYSSEKIAKKIGNTRGASRVTEYNPKTGRVRSWHENYMQNGKVNRVHPKDIDGQRVKSLHYPLTQKELEATLKTNK